MLFDNGFDGLLLDRQNVEPEQHGPQTIFFANVVRARAKALFAAESGFIRIEQITKKLPAGGRFVAFDAELLSDAIGRLAGGHRSRYPG